MNFDLNALQATKVGRDYSTDMEKYLVQSLANLGQRLGVKGDSIKTGSFSFKDIFDNNDAKAFNSLTHIGLIERRYGVMYTSIVPKSTLSIGKGVDAIDEQVFGYGNTLVFDNAKEILVSSERIDSYKRNSFITTLKSGKYIFCGIGQKNGEAVEFVYEEYDRDTDNLMSAFRIYSPKDTNRVIGISFIVVSQNKAEAEIFNIGVGENVLSDTLGKIESILNSLNRFDTDTYMGASNEAYINSMSLNYWIDYLKLPRIGTNYDKINNIEYVFGSEITDNIFANNVDKIESISKKYGGHDLRSEFQVFQYDKKESLPELKEFFTDSLYAASKSSFRKQIVCALFNGIYPKFPSNAKIYVPLDYIFNYYCNSNDSWKIYGGIQDINVRFINTNITYRNIESYYADDQWLANISGDNQSALFNYSVQYSDENTDLVYAVNVEKKYTLPYINSDNVWVINNQITNIPASGKDAGNPNIIIIYNKNGDPFGEKNKAYKIISGSDKNDIINSEITWQTKSVYIEPIEKINLEDPTIVTKSDLYKIACRVPYLETNKKISQSLLTKIQYALIINISSVSCFDKVDETVRNRYGENGVVTTLWSYDNISNEFKVVTNPAFDGVLDNVALDIVHLTNLNNLVKWHVINHEPKHPDRYTHSWLVFDNAKLETKNSENDYRTYIYPVLENKTAEQYDVSLYENDFNFILKYVDTVEGAVNQNIQNVSNSSSKYLLSDKLNVFNNLYNKRSSNVWNEYMPNQDLPMFDLGEVLVKDQNILNRSNIISLDNDGNMFYSYIGSSFDEINKNRVHIGSSKSNINFGEDTMISNAKRNLFKKPNELHFDFENTFTNGFAYISKDLDVKHDIRTHHINWNVQDMTDKTIYSTTFIPSSRMMIQYNPNEKYDGYMSVIQFNNTNRISFTDKGRDEVTFGTIKRYFTNKDLILNKYNNPMDAKFWIPLMYYNDNDFLFSKKSLIYLCDGIYLPSLLARLELDDYAKNLIRVKLTTNMKVINYSGQPLILISANRFLETTAFTSSTNSASVNFVINNDNIYTGYPLEISYYKTSIFLHITINELSCDQRINNLFKLQLDYQ